MRTFQLDTKIVLAVKYLFHSGHNFRNSFNYSTSLFIERLYAKPVLTQAAINQTRLIGEMARLTCEFLSDLHPSIYWMYFTKQEYIYNETIIDASTKESIVYKDVTKIVMVRVE